MCVYTISMVIVGTLFHLVVAESDQCSGLSMSINPDADVKFSVITTIRQTTDGEHCGNKISLTAIENIAAMQWVVDRMNTNNYTGVTIGFDVHDDCGIPRNTMARALDILDGPILGTPACASSNTTTCNIGIIGSSQSSSTEAMLYALQGSNLPVIGPYATFHNITRYKNYYRTIATDDLQIQATAKLLNILGLTYIAIVHTDDDFGRYSAETLQEISKANGICVDSIQAITNGPDININHLMKQRDKTKHKSLRVVFFGRKDVFQRMQTELGFSKSDVFNISWIVVEHSEDTSTFHSIKALDNGTYVISPTVYKVQDLNDFLRDKWNKSQSTDQLEQLIKCSVQTQVPDFTNRNIASTIDAVFVLAAALQRQSKWHCGGSMCTRLREKFEFDKVEKYPIIYRDTDENVTVVEFSNANRRPSFQGNGEFLPGVETTLYDVMYFANQDNFTKIGEFRNQTMYMNETAASQMDPIPSSLCNDDCAVCDDKPNISFAFLDGETFILGIFSVHETDPNNPFKCSQFRTSQMDVVVIETFMYTVQQVRDETGIQFGAIAVDDCYSSAQVELVLNQVFSGELILTNPYTGMEINVKRIAAVVMTVGSSVTIHVSRLMSELKIPVISASASSPDLDDRINFPYFLRTVPSDVEQARAMISIIKRMGWEYVSLLYVENNYGSKGKEAFIRLANESGICIADSPEGISDVQDDNLGSELISVFNRLKNQRTDIVVYFGTEMRIVDFLKAVKEANEFILLASEDWGDRQYILEIGKHGTLGSVILKNDVETLADDPLADYIRNLSPNAIPSTRNPWFVEYWEENFLCDLPQSFRNKYNKQCDETVKFTNENIVQFVEDQRIVHTVVAVKAIAHGLKRSKEEYFCITDTFPCLTYFNHISEIVSHIREVKIERSGTAVRVFKDDGNGNIGFEINNVQESGDGNLEYNTVGSYNEGHLTLEVGHLKFYQTRTLDGSCSGTLCAHCTNTSFTEPVTIATVTHSDIATAEYSLADYTIIAMLGVLFVVIVVMGIITICFFKRRILELETQLKETKYEIRTGYALHNGSSFSAANITSITYPDLQFANTSPSADTMYEWRKAQNALNDRNSKFSNSNGGVVNNGFVDSEMYLHVKHSDDEDQQRSSSSNVIISPRRQTSNSDQTNTFPDSPVYRPPSTSYGFSTHSSFKKPADHNQNGHTKKQPRTQLAVPPCRPELPPRDVEQQRMHEQRPKGFTDKLDHVSSAVPKKNVRKVRSSPKKTVSPPSLKHNPSPDESPRYRDTNYVDSSKYNGSPANMTFSENNLPSPGMVNLVGSMEKISRV